MLGKNNATLTSYIGMYKLYIWSQIQSFRGKGNLETFPLHSILQHLHNDSKTGVFQANRDDEAKIYFIKGTLYIMLCGKNRFQHYYKTGR